MTQIGEVLIEVPVRDLAEVCGLRLILLLQQGSLLLSGVLSPCDNEVVTRSQCEIIRAINRPSVAAGEHHFKIPRAAKHCYFPSIR
jgi:hypothetical protein